MIIYTLIGLLWTLFFEWLLRTYGPNEDGLSTNRARLFHIFGWPLAIFLVIRYYKDTDE